MTKPAKDTDLDEGLDECEQHFLGEAKGAWRRRGTPVLFVTVSSPAPCGSKGKRMCKWRRKDPRMRLCPFPFGFLATLLFAASLFPVTVGCGWFRLALNTA